MNNFFLPPLPAANSNLGKKPRVYTPDEWEEQHGTFTRLYLNEDPKLTLAVVRTIMAEEHGFYATDAQYKKKIKAWGLEKNLDMETALAMLRIEDRRGGKPTTFKYKGQVMSRGRMVFLRKRLKGLVHRNEVDVPVDTPPNVKYFTPSPGGDVLEGSGGGADLGDGVAVAVTDVHLSSSKFDDSKNTKSPPPDAVPSPFEGVRKADLESRPHDQPIGSTSLTLGDQNKISTKQEQRTVNDSTSKEQIQWLLSPPDPVTMRPNDYQLIKVHSSDDDGATFGLTGALWPSPGGRSIIGSWIQNDVVMSGMSPFSFKSQSSHTSKSPAFFASCCGTPFSSPYNMLSHHESRYAQHQNKRLFELAKCGNKEEISFLLWQGINPSVQNEDGETALHLAADGGHEAVIRLLLEKGADHSIQNKDGETALHFAADRGHETVVHLLLEKSADLSIQNARGDTALHLATGSGHGAVVRLLLEGSADLLIRNKNGNTARHLAAYGGHEAVVGLLLGKSADPSIQNKCGEEHMWGDGATFSDII